MKNNQTEKEYNLDNHWHLDKRVPLAIVVALVLQTIYFTIFITKLDSRVGTLEGKVVEMSGAYKEVVEIRVHQEYLQRQMESLDKFLRDDVEWIKPKPTRAR